MKKILFLSALVVAAVNANASQISWGNASTSAVATDPSGTAYTAGANKFYAQLIFVPTGVSVGDMGVGNGATGVATYGVSVIGTTATKAAGQLSTTSYNYTFGSTQVDSQTLTTGGAFFIRLWTSTVDGEGYYMDMYADGAWGSSMWTITAANNTQNDAFSWASGSYGGAQWHAVPEPATMALLGIGVVAVGLRRRRK